GMASNRVTKIVQIPNGEIWIATQDGISKFDGLYWTTKADSSIVPMGLSGVQMEVISDSSLIMTGSNSEGPHLFKYKNDQWSSLPLPGNDKLSYLLAKGINFRSTNLILGSQDKIYRYHEEQWIEIVLSDFDKNEQIKDLVSWGVKTLIATNKRLLLVENNQFKPLLKQNNILNITIDDTQDRCYLLLESELAYYDLKKGEMVSLLKGDIGNTYGHIHQSNLLLKGQKIYYSMNSPLIQYNPQTNTSRAITSDYYNLDHTCMDAIVDNEGSIWVATLRGAFRVKNSSIYNYNDESLVENEVSSILQDSDGTLYLGANIGLSVIHPNGKIRKYPLSSGLERMRVMDIIKHQGEIYFTTYTRGVRKFTNKGILELDSQVQMEGASDLCSFMDTLYCSDYGNLYKWVNSDWQLITTTPNNSTIRKIFFTENYRLLLTENGVRDLTTNKVYTGSDIYMSNVYTALEYNNQILLGTASGIYTIQNEKIVPTEYKIHAPVYALTSDQNNELWVGTGSGVWHFRDEGSYHYYKGNGLIGNEVNRNAFQFSKNGSLLVGTDEGISIIDTSDETSIPIPNIEITSIEVNQKEIDDYNLSYQTNNLRFHFRSTSYYDIESLNYRFRLIGLSEEWEYINFAEQNSTYYPNLDPGEYVFEVQARIDDGTWSNSAKSDKLTIHAAFYEAVWFRILFVILIISGLVAFYRYRSNVLTEQKEELEERVLEKTRELEKRNKELIKTIDDLKAAQGQLIQSEKLASMGHLTSGIAHELNNPLNYIRGGAECIIRNLDELSEILNERGNDVRTIMDESRMLAESIFDGATKSTSIVKSLGSFTADSQNFYSFTDLQKEVETSLTLLGNEIGFRIVINRMFGNIPPIECYPAKINQMMVNILLNAIQAITESGEITIRYYRKDDQNIAIEISDDGEGIASDLHEKVFEPFFTTKDSNPGLGLTIAKSIVQEHNGTISFISKPGVGSKVKISLPVSQTYHPELEGSE
ncbi:MAG TPA: hypothetical protein DHN29_09675, partial [Cytophagales bacterium]|nr:hypothetical protein [Cytophagales bacterium]